MSARKILAVIALIAAVLSFVPQAAGAPLLVIAIICLAIALLIE